MMKFFFQKLTSPSERKFHRGENSVFLRHFILNCDLICKHGASAKRRYFDAQIAHTLVAQSVEIYMRLFIVSSWK